MSPEPLEPHLSFHAKHRLGTLQLEATFALTEPWTVLFGHSGSGKSTVLRIIAGLLNPASGKITVHGIPLLDTSTNINLSSHLRPIRWCGQHAALFPHMTVRQNLTFAHPDDTTVHQALDHFHLGPLANKRPSQLSGGEAQRTAVARAAIQARGRILLLDEPFTGLDTQIRLALIHDLKTWLGPTPVISVTHDVAEAIHLRAHVLRIADGRILAQGPAVEVLAPDLATLRQLLAP